MIISAMNNPEYLMTPISQEKLDKLIDELGELKLGLDLKYLSDIGLVSPDWGGFSVSNNVFFNIRGMSLTQKGVDYANDNTIGSQLSAVTIQIHKNTLEQLETIIQSADISDNDKKNLLQILKEKGSETLVGKCVDTLFSNAGLVAATLTETIKRFSH